MVGSEKADIQKSHEMLRCLKNTRFDTPYGCG